MAFFQNQAQDPNASPLTLERAALEKKKSTAVTSLWLILVFSVINLISLNTLGTYFVFSAELPLYVMSIIQAMASLAAEEGLDVSAMFTASYVAAGALIIPYLIVALLANKHRSAVITAAVFWGIDTLVTLLVLLDGDFSMLIDFAFHIVGFVELIAGASAMKKLKNLPNEVPMTPTNEVPDEFN